MDLAEIRCDGVDWIKVWVRFEVLMVVKMSLLVFWVETRRFGEAPSPTSGGSD
jgi:hypothetical protein